MGRGFGDFGTFVLGGPRGSRFWEVCTHHVPAQKSRALVADKIDDIWERVNLSAPREWIRSKRA